MKNLLKFRRTNRVFSHDNFLTRAQCVWFRPDAEHMKDHDWQHFVRALSCRIKEKTGNLFFIFNGYEKELGYRCKHILTGGSAIYLKDILKHEFTYDETLCLEGLNRILMRNEDK